MSGNIHDTKVSLIKSQVKDLIDDLESILSKQENVCDWEVTLKRRYQQLNKTSSTLFNFIIKQYGTHKFDKSSFEVTLDIMLQKITSIQQAKMTQEDASVEVGTHLAQKYIPQFSKHDNV